MGSGPSHRQPPEAGPQRRDALVYAGYPGGPAHLGPCTLAGGRVGWATPRCSGGSGGVVPAFSGHLCHPWGFSGVFPWATPRRESLGLPQRQGTGSRKEGGRLPRPSASGASPKATAQPVRAASLLCAPPQACPACVARLTPASDLSLLALPPESSGFRASVSGLNPQMCMAEGAPVNLACPGHHSPCAKFSRANRAGQGRELAWRCSHSAPHPASRACPSAQADSLLGSLGRLTPPARHTVPATDPPVPAQCLSRAPTLSPMSSRVLCPQQSFLPFLPPVAPQRHPMCPAL